MAVKQIPVEWLQPHPKNPRGSVGDISELADSIKTNGVLQNLTVVKDPEGPLYTVVIGHRRLEAAKAAGLATVPCNIVNLTPAEQQAMMLTENMQRTDLTMYEQIHGIQMCLDLGLTIEDISSKTGMSKTSIGNRKRMLQFDQEKVKKTLDEGTATMQDYLAVDHIGNEKVREELISKYIGTPSFARELRQAQENQRWEIFTYSADKRLSTFAKKIDSKDVDRSAYEQAGFWGKWSLKDEHEFIHVPEDWEETEYLYTVDEYRIVLYKLREEPEEMRETEEEAVKRRWEDHMSVVDNFFQSAQLGRTVFLEQLGELSSEEWIQKYGSQVDKLLLKILRGDLVDIDTTAVMEYIVDMENIEYDEDEKPTAEAEQTVLRTVHGYSPHYLAFLAMFNEVDEDGDTPMLKRNWRTMEMVYDRDNYEAKRYLEMYEFLEEYGYLKTENERMLLDGTHPCYKLPDDE